MNSEEALKEGAAAALADNGAGNWSNPYLKLLAEAHSRGESIAELVSKANAWEQGWQQQVAKITGV